jgi:hypothetical protein
VAKCLHSFIKTDPYSGENSMAIKNKKMIIASLALASVVAASATTLNKDEWRNLNNKGLDLYRRRVVQNDPKYIQAEQAALAALKKYMEVTVDLSVPHYTAKERKAFDALLAFMEDFLVMGSKVVAMNGVVDEATQQEFMVKMQQFMMVVEPLRQLALEEANNPTQMALMREGYAIVLNYTNQLLRIIRAKLNA